MAKTIWDEAIEEGMERGIEKGVEKGIDVGRAEGLVRGAIQAKQDWLLLVMAEKFGPVPKTVAGRVRAIEDPAVLEDLMRQVLRADRLDAIRF